MMKTYPTDYFLKENNDIEGKEYYTLVEANLRNTSMTQAQAQAWYPEWCKGMAVADAMTIEEQYTPEGGSATYVTVEATVQRRIIHCYGESRCTNLLIAIEFIIQRATSQIQCVVVNRDLH